MFALEVRLNFCALDVINKQEVKRSRIDFINRFLVTEIYRSL
jgi:hypothetical protein